MGKTEGKKKKGGGGGGGGENNEFLYFISVYWVWYYHYGHD